MLQKDMVTAPFLAEHFEVSRRTINRDIEDLCKVGIPIATRQGTGGEIYIMDNYKISKTLITNAEMQDILAGIRSLDSVNGTNQYKQLMEKLETGSSDFLVGEQSLLIDLSSWYKESLAPKIQIIRSAIKGCCKITFYYYGPSGEAQRTIEPYYLVFRWSNWYVWGWCDTRRDYRLFKLNRLDELEADCKWRLVEEFGTKCFEEQADGKLLFQAEYTDKENLITWLLTFRNKVILLEPEEIRMELFTELQKTLQQYK